MTFAGANEAAVVSTGVCTYMCACNNVAGIEYIIVPTHDTALNAGLELELARPAMESHGAVAHVACRCALGGTLLPFGARASRHVRI